MRAAGGERDTPGQQHEGRGRLGGDAGGHAARKAAVVKAVATLGRRTEAAALSSALATVAGSGRGVQGLTTTPHGLYVCFLAGWEGMFATDGAVAPGHEALGTDDLGGHRLNSQSTAMSPEGEIKPTRSQTKTPIGRVGNGEGEGPKGNPISKLYEETKNLCD